MGASCTKPRRMADGGVLLTDSGKQETAEELLQRMNAKYGLGSSQPASTSAPSPQPKPASSSAPRPATGTIQDSISSRNAELKKVSSYASGGVVLPKGKTVPIRGKGTGSSDSIPAVVAGQHVRLSNGEGAAVLPAKTMKNEAAVEAIEAIIEATNGKPPVQREESSEMKRGGIRKCAAGGIMAGVRRYDDGGVIDPRKKTDYVVPTAAPTAQQVYQPAVDAIKNAPQIGAPLSLNGGEPAPTAQDLYGGVSIKGVADALTPDSTGPSSPATQSTPGVVSRMISSIPDGGYLLPEKRGSVDWNNGLAGDRGILGPKVSQEATAAAPVVGKSPAALPQPPAPAQSQSASVQPSRTGAAIESNVGATSAVEANTDNSGAITTPSGTQQVNMGAGFDPTKLKMADGYGMITGANGRTMVVSPAASASHGVSVGPVDAYGNIAAITTQLRGELDRAQAENAAVRAAQQPAPSDPSVPAFRSPSEVADSKRFDRFVQEANFNSLLHDLATGGDAKTVAGKVAALQAAQGILQSADANDTHLANTKLFGQNELAATALRGKNQLADISASGRNQLAVAGLQGQNALDLENSRQNSPAQLMATEKVAGEVADSITASRARENLARAAASGDPVAYRTAQQQAIAYGILKPTEDKPVKFSGHSNPLGGLDIVQTEGTGAGTATRIGPDGKSTTVPPPGQKQSSGIDVKVGMDVNVPDGTHTFEGKIVTVKGKKVVGVSNG